MESSDQNIFVELKKKFYRSTYSDKYGGSIFSTFFYIDFNYIINNLLSINEKCVRY